MVDDLELFDITHNTMTVRWKGAEGASGYMILYAPLTEEEPSDEKEVRTVCLCSCLCCTVGSRKLLTTLKGCLSVKT